MYKPAKSLLLRLFKVSGEPPEPPSGSHQVTRVLRASPRYLTYRMIPVAMLVLAGGAALAASSVAVLASDMPSAVLLILALGALLLPFPLLLAFGLRVDYDLRYYVLTDTSVRVREGAWVTDEKTLTYANVQNVRVEQGPIQRLFGISDVRIDTAGGGATAAGQQHAPGGHGVVLAGLEDAADVRALVLERLGAHSAGAGLGDLDDEPSTRGLSSAALDALRGVAAEARELRAAAERAVRL